MMHGIGMPADEGCGQGGTGSRILRFPPDLKLPASSGGLWQGDRLQSRVKQVHRSGNRSFYPARWYSRCSSPESLGTLRCRIMGCWIAAKGGGQQLSEKRPRPENPAVFFNYKVYNLNLLIRILQC